MSYIVVASAKFYRRLSSPLTLLGLMIDTVDTPPAARITVTVEASSDATAGTAAKALCEQVSGMTRLALGTPLEVSGILSATLVANGIPGASTQYLSAGGVIVGSDVDATAIATATAAESAYAALSTSIEWQVRFALRWYDRALAEPDAADRFAAAWIALETAGYGKGTKVNNILDVLAPIYGSAASRADLKAVLGPIYKSRNALFHQANLDVPTLLSDAQRTLWFTEDILESRLGLTAQHRAIRKGLISKGSSAGTP